MKLLRSQFREAWVVKVSFMERKEAMNLAVVKMPRIAEDSPAIKQEVLPPPQPLPSARGEEKKDKVPPVSDKSDSSIMESAARLMAEGSYTQALDIYKKLLRSHDKEIVRSAREFIGVAYEKGGEFERARAE